MSGISISRSEINRGLHIVVQYIIVRGHCQVRDCPLLSKGYFVIILSINYPVASTYSKISTILND